MFCWTGVPIRYFSHNTLYWKEFWDKPLIIPKTPPSTVFTWFDWFQLLIAPFSQQTLLMARKMFQSPFPWWKQDLENNKIVFSLWLLWSGTMGCSSPLLGAGFIRDPAPMGRVWSYSSCCSGNLCDGGDFLFREVSVETISSRWVQAINVFIS